VERAGMDVGGWLRGLGLGEYEENFATTESMPTYCRS
jgi:hypothetical protein